LAHVLLRANSHGWFFVRVFFLYDNGLLGHRGVSDRTVHNSAAENVLRYPRPQRPIIEETFATTNPQLRDLSDAPGMKKEEVPAKKDEPEKNINDSRVLFAKSDIAKHKREIKNKPERLAHLSKPKGFALQREKPKVFARHRNNYDERAGYYGNASGYAEQSWNGPQRLFSNW
jgi:hypothetical protein